jgi:tRNA A-37 threonylcarbamoyl transferase component Bud32
MLTFLFAARSTTPPITAGLVLKHFSLEKLISAYQEANAYSSLKVLQGLIIPYCYGVYDIEGQTGVGLLFEKIEGVTLDEALLDMRPELDETYQLYMDCWKTLVRLHDAGFSHGDISGSNVLICSQHNVVFTDFENSR